MKIFNIEIITKKPKAIYWIRSHEGRITIGDFSEKFIIPVEDWSLEDYKKQWGAALMRLEHNPTSCLVTSVANLDTAYASIEMWSLYKEDAIIYFNNNLLIDKTMQNKLLKLSEFNEKTCYEFVSYPRETYTEQGNLISEWSISADVFFASVEGILNKHLVQKP